MAITYIPDLDFHKRVDDALNGLLEVAPDSNRADLDQALTEGLLAEEIWPVSWEELMTDHDKAYLVQRIVRERGERS
ncbi:hypothetical protein [Devosia sp. SL43]|uniref:hypothetical protein n=1 Tax=Devosia sp. SL43 TaxID=2806348 RepID=UPI001F1E6304|nr:hypothetical protein [Devosia sp. SL43]UJW85773.1 hypothetical protein IM737_00240 [Devosia sp. SL43]